MLKDNRSVLVLPDAFLMYMSVFMSDAVSLSMKSSGKHVNTSSHSNIVFSSGILSETSINLCKFVQKV